MTALSLKGSHGPVSHPRIIIFFLLISIAISLPSIGFCKNHENAYLIDRALEVIAMKRGDLAVRSDLSTNPFTLSRFRRWMEDPLKAPIKAQHKAVDLFNVADKQVLWIQELATFGDMYSSMPLPLIRYSDYSLPTHLPGQLEKAICLTLDAINTANIRLSVIKKSISPEKMKLIEQYLYPDSCPYSLPEKQREDLIRIKELRKAIEAAGSVDIKGVLEAGLTIIAAIENARTLLMETDRWYKNVSSFSINTSLGLVEIGGPGADIHENHAALIIDLGGNDLYRGKIASGADCMGSVVLDLAGNDIYLGEDNTQASGVWGVGILFDLEGDDLYKAGNCSQGAGLFGLGLLMDGRGHDSYLGAKFVQAASSWGFGGLIDLGGEDSYHCHQSGQAYSGVLGMSCLCDLSGNDKYISGRKSPDPREPDMNQSFSQGFAIGMRNLTGGGFALLADKSGSDLYQCQYFGQGASYWMGIGILYDETGKDSYVARRYAQGAGIHYSLGLLIDAEGNDHTFSWGVSQGCGHDYGIGILVNEGGNDTYASDWLSLGASEANGVGIFIDNSGDDGYETSTGLAVGHLVKKRRAGGIGLFIDAGGQDRYSKNGSDNSIWGSNRWSIGIDEDKAGISGLKIVIPKKSSSINNEAEKERKKEKTHLSDIMTRSEEMPYPDNMEGMLSVAAHWGLEKKIPDEARKKLLNMEPEKSVPAMVNFLDTPDIMSLIFMERVFTVHAFHSISELIKKSEDSDPLIKSRAFHYLGKLKDSRALTYCVDALKNSSWGVKSAAIRTIGEILNKKRLKILMPMKEVFDKALKANDPDIIRDYLGEDKKIIMVLSVLARSVPLDYQTYLGYKEMPSNGEKEKVLKDYIHFVYDNLSETIPLLKRWINDINNSADVAKKLMACIDDPDPAVRKATSYSLGQMNFLPAITKLLSLLKDPDLWVRDSTVLSLAMFKDKTLHPLDLAMEQEISSFKILGLDVLAGVRSDPAKVLIERYLDDPDKNVRRAARRALSNLTSAEKIDR